MIKEIPAVAKKFLFICDKCNVKVTLPDINLPEHWQMLQCVTDEKEQLSSDDTDCPTGIVTKDYTFCAACVRNICESINSQP